MKLSYTWKKFSSFAQISNYYFCGERGGGGGFEIVILVQLTDKKLRNRNKSSDLTRLRKFPNLVKDSYLFL